MDARKLTPRRLMVTNVRVIEDGEHHDIQFDLDWREAFRAGEHWSAAWVFLKINRGQTETVESTDSAVDKLAKSGQGDHRASLRSEIARAFAGKLPPGKPPLPPLPLPPMPRAIRDRLAQRSEASSDEGKDETATPGRSRPPTPLHALRLLHRHIEDRGHNVEVDDDFAFLTPSTDSEPAKMTTFTRWLHLKLSNKAEDHKLAPGTVITPSEDGMGVFIYRASNDRGPLQLRGVRLRTTEPCKGEALKVWVGALEMVHIPAGDFHVGDPQGPEGPRGCFYRSGAESEADQSFVVRSEDEIAVGEEPGQLFWDNADQMGEPANIPSEFPKGHAAFYIQKNQVTQGEYCDFINHLRGHQLTIRYPYGGQGDYRYTVFKTHKSPRVCTRPERAANWTSWADARAYLWWTGLRPLTELEFEKAARGPLEPVANEYAWGSTTLVQSMVILGSEHDEPIVQGNCNVGNTLQEFCGGDGGQGPVPDDSFRASRYQCEAEAVHLTADCEETFTWREETGGSYYEVMGLSGNLWEYTISVGMDEGRRFTGQHGTGNLDQSGAPDGDNDWPLADNVGLSFRGGSWYTKAESARVADRCFGSGLLGYSDRSHDTGMRAARTPPKIK